MLGLLTICNGSIAVERALEVPWTCGRNVALLEGVLRALNEKAFYFQLAERRVGRPFVTNERYKIGAKVERKCENSLGPAGMLALAMALYVLLLMPLTGAFLIP
jgi:hypothetical protein